MRVVFFDGVCNLCNQSVDLLIRLDRQHLLKYAPLQGETAKRELESQNLSLSTIVYKSEGQIFTQSSAVLMILRDLGGIGWLAQVFWILPQGLRDSLYGFVARHRYQFFGKRDTCRLPTPEEKALFLP